MLPAGIARLVARDRPKIIAIDGDLGAGKTQLARALARQFGFPVVHLDDHIGAGAPSYVESIRIDAVRDAILAAGRPVVIEGICLRRVLDALDIVPDLHLYARADESTRYKAGDALVGEVADYAVEGRRLADEVIRMSEFGTNQLDVDIAYLKAKTIVSVVLALGGISSLIVGALLLTSGMAAANSAVLEIAGARLTAEGLGAVILGSSVFWAYFAYLARPKYSRRKETKSRTMPDGGQESYEFESSTMTNFASRQGERDS